MITKTFGVKRQRRHVTKDTNPHLPTKMTTGRYTSGSVQGKIMDMDMFHPTQPA